MNGMFRSLSKHHIGKNLEWCVLFFFSKQINIYMQSSLFEKHFSLIVNEKRQIFNSQETFSFEEKYVLISYFRQAYLE